jgi:hypothetical protein
MVTGPSSEGGRMVRPRRVMVWPSPASKKSSAAGPLNLFVGGWGWVVAQPMYR